jgi:hypothetical protein
MDELKITVSSRYDIRINVAEVSCPSSEEIFNENYIEEQFPNFNVYSYEDFDRLFDPMINMVEEILMKTGIIRQFSEAFNPVRHTWFNTPSLCHTTSKNIATASFEEKLEKIWKGQQSENVGTRPGS